VGEGTTDNPHFDIHYDLYRGTYRPDRGFLACMLEFKPEKFKYLNKCVSDEITDFLRAGDKIENLQNMVTGMDEHMREKDNRISLLTRDEGRKLEQVELALAEANKKLERTDDELANLNAYLTTLRINPPQQQHNAGNTKITLGKSGRETALKKSQEHLLW
jgi:chromosome segregation ATPase